MMRLINSLKKSVLIIRRRINPKNVFMKGEEEIFIKLKSV